MRPIGMARNAAGNMIEGSYPRDAFTAGWRVRKGGHAPCRTRAVQSRLPLFLATVAGLVGCHQSYGCSWGCHDECVVVRADNPFEADHQECIQICDEGQGLGGESFGGDGYGGDGYGGYGYGGDGYGGDAYGGYGGGTGGSGGDGGPGGTSGSGGAPSTGGGGTAGTGGSATGGGAP